MRLILDIYYPDAGKWQESKHPRGQPENAGQFVKGTAPGTLQQIAKDPAKLNALSESSHTLGQQLSGSISNVSSHALKAIAEWTISAGYKWLNNHLRGTAVDPKAAKHAEWLQKAIQQHPLLESVHVYRGVHGPQSEELRKRKQGELFSQPGFFSTTLDPKRATHFAQGGKGDLIHLLLPKGAQALYVSHPGLNSWEAERELLLPHNSNFKYLGNEEIELPQYHYSGRQTGGMQKVRLHHLELSQGK